MFAAVAQLGLKVNVALPKWSMSDFIRAIAYDITLSGV
jgi:hypothetical protein